MAKSELEFECKVTAVEFGLDDRNTERVVIHLAPMVVSRAEWDMLSSVVRVAGDVTVRFI